MIVWTKYSLWPSCSNCLVIMSLPHFGEEHNRLQKELNGLGHRFLFWMAQLVWGTMRVMHSQILIEVDGIKN